MLLRHWIEENNVEEIAKRLNVTETTVYMWKWRRNMPTPKHFMGLVELSLGRINYQESLRDYMENQKRKHNLLSTSDNIDGPIIDVNKDI